MRAGACVPSSVSSATLQIAGDNYYYAYLNGSPLGNCVAKNCYGTYVSITVSPALINLPPADNVLAVYVSDSTGGQASGGSWRLTINYVGCPTQYVDSDGFCTRTQYAGLWAGGPPGGGWEATAFADGSWGGAWAGNEDLCGAACGGTPNNAWDAAETLSIPWIWGTNTFVSINAGDGYLFRQHFRAGDPSYCSFPPLPTPTPFGGTATRTHSPTRTPTLTPPASPTWTPTRSPTPTASPTRTDSPTPSRTPSFTPTATPSWSPTATPSFSPSHTRTVTPTFSPTPSATPSFTLTNSPSATPSRTPSATLTHTSTATPSSTQTVTFTLSSTPSHTPSATPSLTLTSSSTPSATRTASATLTASPSATPSFSATPSATESATLTHSPTVTHSRTSTITFSFTATLTDTPTATPSRTLTGTPSFTPTRSDSPTQTASPTLTLTYTDTPLASATATPSHSPTSSVTGTATPTPSPSPSATPSSSPTATPSATGSATPSATPTSTPSLTSTPSASPSATETFQATPSASPTVTPTSSPTATHTPSATPTPSFSPSSSSTATPSASPTATETFLATASASPTATPTSSATATHTPSATPTPSFSPSSSSTASPSATLSATPTPSLTEPPTPAPSATPTQSFTVSPTFTPAPPFHVTLRVFNQAGEEVGLIASQLGMALKPEGLSSSQAVVLPDDGKPGIVELTGTGVFISWDGSNNAGQAVASGLYYVVATLEDAFGKLESWTLPLQVLRAALGSVVEVYNSAGELVWSQALASPPDGHLALSEPQFLAGQPSGLKISFGSGPADYVIWDGLGSQGQALQAGSYTVKLTKLEQGGGKLTVAKPVVLLLDLAQVFSAVLPSSNPVPAGQAQLLLTLQGAAAGTQAWGEAHNLAGERIGGLGPDPAGLAWTLPSGLAPGVYLIRVSARSPLGRQQHQVVKISVLR